MADKQTQEEVANLKVLADEELTNLQYKFERTLCPIFKTNCNGKVCHSYYEGKVHRHTLVKADRNVINFQVYAPRCESPLVTGRIEHDGTLDVSI
jgi:hypothetical protein